MELLLDIIFWIVAVIIPVVLIIAIILFIAQTGFTLLHGIVNKTKQILSKFRYFISSLFTIEFWRGFILFLPRLAARYIALGAKLATEWLNSFLYEAIVHIKNVTTIVISGLFGIFSIRYSSSRRRKVKTLFTANKEEIDSVIKSRTRFLELALQQTQYNESREILELPPGYPEELLDENLLLFVDAITQRAMLKWQINNYDAMIFSRVVDAIELTLRQEGLTRKRSDGRHAIIDEVKIDISLKRNRHKAKLADAKNDTVIIGTNIPDIIGARLKQIRNWLGVGIELAEPLDIEKFSHCKESPEKEGDLAGLLVAAIDGESVENIKVYGLTCKHVAPSCKCIELDVSDDYTKVPDAILVDYGNSCFRRDEVNLTPYTVATKEQLERFSCKDVPVRRKGGISKRYAGLIENPLTTYKDHRGIISDFPTFSIVLDRKWFLGIVPWPFRRKLFSQPGDSGSWVVGDNQEWLGMLAGGSQRARLSYVLIGSALIAYFEERINVNLDRESNISLVPILIE